MPINFPIEYPKTDIIVVIPTYNEADNIEKIAQEVLRQPARVDLLIVDDNSPDGTGRLADALAASENSAGRVHVLHRAAKEGLGRAYLAGFAWAMERGYDAVVEMDADLSHDPLYLQSMTEAAQEADVVIGSRYLNGISVINWPLRRILLVLGRELVCANGDAPDRQRLHQRLPAVPPARLGSH